MDWKRLLRSMWVSPREHPEFKDFLARAALDIVTRPAKPRPPGGSLA